MFGDGEGGCIRVRADGFSVVVYGTDTPVIFSCIGTRIFVVAAEGILCYAVPFAVLAGLCSVFAFRWMNQKLYLIAHAVVNRNPLVNGIEQRRRLCHLVKGVYQRCCRHRKLCVDDELFRF